MIITDTIIRTHGLSIGIPGILSTDNGSGYQLAALQALSTTITLPRQKTSEVDTSFGCRTLRLKQCLRMKYDKEVAEELGLSKRAWVGRRNSGRFPIKELESLAYRKPHLNLDVNYILTGVRS